jgi:hypothetical protein
MATVEKVVKLSLHQNELCAIELLVVDRMHYLKADKTSLQYLFLKRLRRKLKRNIHVRSFKYEYKKNLIYVKS